MYGNDEIKLSTIEEQWEKITNKYFVESAQLSPQVTVSLDSYAVVFTIRYIVFYKLRRMTKDLILKKILNDLFQAPIEVNLSKIPLDISSS
ncbi:MAG: hypothetical protein AAGA80_17985 [Cyanobacteria bacterium P01_F01_bin.143]